MTEPLSDASLTRERNHFLLWMLAFIAVPVIGLFILALFVGLRGAAQFVGTQQFADLKSIAEPVAMALYAWRIWILCRVLRFHWWWTAIYCVLSVTPLAIVPLVYLFFAFKRARALAQAT